VTRPHPQRISPLSRPGELLKQLFAIPRRHEPSPDRDANYLALVRQLPCLKCGMEPSEAAHVRMSSAAFGKTSGLAKKPEDRFAVSLCADCHRLAKHAQHNRNEQEFWNSLGINPLLCAAELYAARGDLVAMRSVILLTIANRNR
jgi:hypothetical protein